MENDEFILGAIESPMDLRDYNYSMLSASIDEIDLPEEYVLDYTYPILNQGNIGSCVAHSLSCMKSYIDGTNTDNMYSIGFIYANRQEDDWQGKGLVTRQALKNLVKYGDCKKESFPINEEYPDICNTLNRYGKEKLLSEAQDHKSLAYIRLEKDNIKEYLVKYQKPILIGVKVYDNFYDANVNNGCIPADPRGRKRGGHAMLCIGYKKDILVLVNSWGDFNGDNGKYYLDINSSIIDELWALEDKKNVKEPEKQKYTVGWNKDDKGWWYSPDGITYYKSDWKQLNGNWFRFDSEGYAYQNCWFKYEKDGKWYYFDDNCYMVSDQWVLFNDKWYRLGKDGAMLTGWYQDTDGLWYYLDIAKGYMYSDCRILVDGEYYSLNKHGAWVKDGTEISYDLVNNTKEFEGFYSYWYYGDGTATIGYGTSTAGTVGKRLYNSGVTSCTIEEAIEWLREEMQNGCQVLTDWLNENNISLSQNQFDACADVIYNMGFKNFKKFGIADIVLGNKENTWDNWKVCITDINGVEYPGLITRRWSEYKIFNDGDYSVRP